MRKNVLVLPALMALALCMLPEPALAGDARSAALAPVPGIAPADFAAPAMVMLQAPAAEPEAHWIWTLVGSGTFAAVLGALARILQSVIAGIRNERTKQACSFVFSATMTTYQEFVRVTKARHADGKLTTVEKDEALQYAYRKAIEIARTKGVDLLKTVGKDFILAKIQECVGSSKANALAKSVISPLLGSAQSAPSV